MIWLFGLGFLWFRPEYRFLLFFSFAAVALNVVIRGLWQTPELVLEALLALAFPTAIFLVLGAAVVALRKWMKSRPPKGDKELDAEMERIRAEIAARESKTAE